MAMKETQEALVAMALVGKLVIERCKDGVDLQDALAVGTALLTDGKLKAAVEAGVKDASLIDDELRAAKLADFLALAAAVMPEFVALLEAK
jgi:hypothetical protein